MDCNASFELNKDLKIMKYFIDLKFFVTQSNDKTVKLSIEDMSKKTVN